MYEEPAGLLRKTAGLHDVLRDALVPLGDRVSLAFVFGSVAAGTERTGSDVDVMVPGTASFADLTRALADALADALAGALTGALAGVHAALRREVNATVLAPGDFVRKLAQGDGFARSVSKSPRIWLIGGESDLAELVADRKAQGARAHAGCVDAHAQGTSASSRTETRATLSGARRSPRRRALAACRVRRLQRRQNGPYCAAFSLHIPDMCVESGTICPRPATVSRSNAQVRQAARTSTPGPAPDPPPPASPPVP